MDYIRQRFADWLVDRRVRGWLPRVSEWPESVQTLVLLVVAPFGFAIAIAIVAFSMIMGFAFLGWMVETVDHTIPQWWKKRKADE